ncbi:MAG: DUF4190 domain-containing protein [Anaerolineaceae bacterium]|nr:DUF4190 domain-containing protein [Anaerolineaceae bacterium]
MAHYPPQQSYQQPAPPYQAPVSNGLATFSMIAGIMGWTICPGLAAIAAIITGHIAKGQIRASYGRESGTGMANAGLILGYLQIVLSLVGVCVYLVFILGIFGLTEAFAY